MAVKNRLTKEELGEVFLHLACYGGWPVEVNAFSVAEEVFEQG